MVSSNGETIRLSVVRMNDEVDGQFNQSPFVVDLNATVTFAICHGFELQWSI